MARLLAIDADLSEPPSSPLVWRDLTLYAAIRDYTSVAVSPPDMRMTYSRWFAKLGLWDYLDDILTPTELAREHPTIQIEGGPSARLTAHNLWAVLRLLG